MLGQVLFKLILVFACWGTQHWFRQIRLGATRHQAVTWGNVDPVVCHHMVSLGQKEWKLTPFWQVTNCTMTCSSGWDHIIGAHWNLVMPSIYWEPWAIIGNGLLPIIWHKTIIWTHTDFWLLKRYMYFSGIWFKFSVKKIFWKYFSAKCFLNCVIHLNMHVAVL